MSFWDPNLAVLPADTVEKSDFLGPPTLLVTLAYVSQTRGNRGPKPTRSPWRSALADCEIDQNTHFRSLFNRPPPEPCLFDWGSEKFKKPRFRGQKVTFSSIRPLPVNVVAARTGPGARGGRGGGRKGHFSIGKWVITCVLSLFHQKTASRADPK